MRRRRKVKISREEVREEWLTVPNEDMRQLYKTRMRQQRMIALVPFLVLLAGMFIYGFIGWTDYIGSEYSLFQNYPNRGVGIVYYGIFALNGCIMSSKTLRSINLVPLILPIGIFVYGGITGVVTTAALLMTLYSLAVFPALRVIVGDLEYMRDLPSFPFLSNQVEKQTAALTQRELLSEMERAKNGGISSVGFDEIFTSDDPESIVKPPEKTDDYLQQHKYKW